MLETSWQVGANGIEAAQSTTAAAEGGGGRRGGGTALDDMEMEVGIKAAAASIRSWRLVQVRGRWGVGVLGAAVY